MWTRMWQFLRRAWRREAEVKDPGAETLQELQTLKKMLRRQSAFLEEMHQEWAEYSVKEIRANLEPLTGFADAFFYLDQSLREGECLSPQRSEVLDMVWGRLDELLASTEVKMVREASIPFDARLHEALEKVSRGDGRLEVLRTVQPGYLYRDRVVKTAKVIVGSAQSSQPFQQGASE
jgi:molecular chaperone GrpE (heat shock protein)